MAIQLEGIDHVEVFVRNLEQAQRWYADVLGLQEVYRWNPEPVMIGVGGTKLALFLAKGSGPLTPGVRQAQPPIRWHRVAFRTDADGFARAQEHLTALGIKFRGPIDHRTAQSVYFEDLDGNPLEITYYL
jgi:catechol 2,3-dioxygenase-like lactoylglutathione lyase family enzyme